MEKFIINNDLKSLKTFLQKNPEKLNKKNKTGKTPLLLSIIYKNEKITSFLLKKNANPNISCKINNSPLLISVFNKNEKIAKKLIEKNSEIFMENFKGQSPLNLALKNNDNKILELFLLKKNNIICEKFMYTFLHFFCVKGKFEIFFFFEKIYQDSFCFFGWNSKSYLKWMKKYENFNYLKFFLKLFY